MPSERSRRTWPRLLLIAVLALAIAAPTTVWASHRFEDVPDSNIFHEDIDAISDARVTFGCNPPENTRYCPDGNVTRQEMAAFMNRLGALDEEHQPVVDARTVQGLAMYSDVIEVEVENSNDDSEECEPTESLLGEDYEFGTFYASYQLLDVPDVPDLFTFDVNVAASDRDPDGDPPSTGFLVCFATASGDELPDGVYRLFRMEAHQMAKVSE